jgi:CheY-like chemotaxis protein
MTGSPEPTSAGTLVAVRGSVLIVDDDAEFRALAIVVLRSHGYEVVGENADAA